MVSQENDYMKTLPYFLTHGTRTYELCFVMYQDEIKFVTYIDSDERFIQTIPQELWDSKVVDHKHKRIALLECDEEGSIKKLDSVYVHIINIVR